MFKYLFSNPQFAKYFGSSLLSGLGMWTRNMSVLFLVLSLSHNSAGAVGFSLFCSFAPTVFQPVAGVYIDRLRKKATLVTLHLLRTLIILLFITPLVYHSLPLIYLLSFLSGAIGLFSPSRVIARRLTKPEDRHVTVSLMEMVSNATLLFGPNIGIFCAELINIRVGLLLAATMFFVAAFLVFFIKVPNDKRVSGATSSSILADLKIGYTHSQSTPLLRSLLWGNIVLGLVFGLMTVLEVFLVTQFLHLPKSALAAYVSLSGLTMIIGTLFVSKLKLNADILYPLSMLLFGLGVCVSVLYPNILITGFGYVLWGLGNVAMNISLGVVFQTKVKEEVQGRVMSILGTVFTSSMGLAMIISGFIHVWLSIQAIFFLSGVLAIVVGLWTYFTVIHTPSIKSSVEEQVSV